MSLFYPYPAWLEAHVIPDAPIAAAYEAVGAENRAVLKKTIACLHALWGEQPPFCERMRAFGQGFGVQEQAQPAPYALFLIEASYPHPTSLVAALMPALLAGVERILPCFIMDANVEQNAESRQFPQHPGLHAAVTFGGGASAAFPAPGLLAALELAGVEKSFAVTGEAVTSLLPELMENLGTGRLVYLGLNCLAEDTAAYVVQKNIPCMHFPGTPAYLAQEAAFAAQQGQDSPNGPAEDTPLLMLGPEYENIWVWPQLGPEWFQTKRMHVFAV